MILHKLYIFLWQSWVQARSYRAAFLLRNTNLLLPLVALFFMARMFNSVEVPAVARYGGNYVTFTFLGIAVITYSFTGLRAFSASLRSAQLTGTLEALLLTRANLPTIIAGWSLYPFLQSTLQTVGFLAAGFLILRLPLGNANLAGTLLVLAVTVVVMASLGILGASFTLVFKQGDPFTGLVIAASSVLSGVAYPTSLLPEGLQLVALVLPQTHALEAIRLAVLQGHSTAALMPHVGTLLIFALVLVPLALATFYYAMYRAKVDGSLVHY